jgi:Domain of unknown function (DUF4276)
MTLAIAPIVEGHGEVGAIRTLLQRTLGLVAGCAAAVLQPIRIAKSKVVRDREELLRAVDLASLKLASTSADRKVVLLLLDADDDAACVLGPDLLATLRAERAHLDVACVLAVVEYETWLVAGAETLGGYLTAGFAEAIPEDPEAVRAGKGWIQHFFAGTKYSETVDQVRLTSSFDVTKARNRSRSFDKFCRELEKRCRE